MKPVAILFALSLVGLVIATVAFIAGTGDVGIGAGIVALACAGAGLAMANDESRRSHH